MRDLHVFAKWYRWNKQDVEMLTPEEKDILMSLMYEDVQRADAKRKLG